MSSPKELLIDVRTPAEYATGALSNHHYAPADAVNIEYQLINQLPQMYNVLGIEVSLSDRITLYCRSGRRSNIALQTLRELGYSNVRDIGGFEEARAVLKREELLRNLELEKGESTAVTEVDVSTTEAENKRKDARTKSFGTLLDGLKAAA